MIAAKIDSQQITVRKVFADDRADESGSGTGVGVEVVVWGGSQWNDSGIRMADARGIVKDLCGQVC
jgi:hypothetical protein